MIYYFHSETSVVRYITEISILFPISISKVIFFSEAKQTGMEYPTAKQTGMKPDIFILIVKKSGLTLVQMAVKKCVAMRLGVIYCIYVLSLYVLSLNPQTIHIQVYIGEIPKQKFHYHTKGCSICVTMLQSKQMKCVNKVMYYPFFCYCTIFL